MEASRQFDPSSVGPVEARKQYEGSADRRPVQRLFSVTGNDFVPPPHTQTRASFGARPDVFFHGTYHVRPTGLRVAGGVHFGTEEAVEERRLTLGPGRTGEPWRVFPAILRGPHENTPEWAGVDEGERWGVSGGYRKKGIFYYKNDSEDPGSISAVVPKSEYFLTHPQAIAEAKEAGLSVHPLVEWESRQIQGAHDPGRSVLGRQWQEPAEPERFPKFRLPREEDIDNRQLRLKRSALKEVQARGGNPYRGWPQ